MKSITINEAGYNEVKRRIKYNVTLNNGYQLDDLVQDTILKLLKTSKNQSELIKQSVTTAKNLIIDHHRKCQKFKYIYDQEPDGICYQTCKIQIKIPEQYKELYILRYKFKLKYSEISNFLNTPIGTIKARIKKMKDEIIKLNGL